MWCLEISNVVWIFNYREKYKFLIQKYMVKIDFMVESGCAASRKTTSYFESSKRKLRLWLLRTWRTPAASARSASGCVRVCLTWQTDGERRCQLGEEPGPRPGPRPGPGPGAQETCRSCVTLESLRLKPRRLSCLVLNNLLLIWAMFRRSEFEDPELDAFILEEPQQCFLLHCYTTTTTTTIPWWRSSSLRTFVLHQSYLHLLSSPCSSSSRVEEMEPDLMISGCCCCCCCYGRRYGALRRRMNISGDAWTMSGCARPPC